MSGHKKGSSFERIICKGFSKWWTRGKRDDIFWRTANSGGRAKSRSKLNKGTFGQYGDIQATDPIGQPFLNTVVVELKIGYKKWSFLDILDKKDTSADQTFEKFFEQVNEDKTNARVPYYMIITKRDQRVPIVTFPRLLYNEIEDIYGRIKYEYCPFVMRFHYADDVLIACRLSDFLNWCKPEFFINRKFGDKPKPRKVTYLDGTIKDINNKIKRRRNK